MKSEADLHRMIRELLENDADALTAWEVEFLDSVHRQAYFSEKQATIIERIWSKVYG